MKNLLLLVFVILLAGGSTLLNQLAKSALQSGKKSVETRIPIGDAEEKTGEADREDLCEEDDESEGIDHRWQSCGFTSEVDKHVFYQQVLFKNLDRKVVIPPPKG